MRLVPKEEYRYVFFATRFGFTPDQVDNLPLSLSRWYMPISRVIDAEADRRQAELFKDQTGRTPR